MESATFLLLASGMGVMFGWQPMPDGSAGYEYVVQLEPELVATLEEGQSIPISSDVPEDIHPIARIRIVVGREPLPRRLLTTQFKPWPGEIEKKSREGVLETQYRVQPVEPSGSGKYRSTASQPILPPGSTASSNAQRLTQSQQNAFQSSQNPSQILPPQDNQGIVGTVQGATRELGNQLRSVGDSVRTDAQQLFGTANSNGISGVLGQAGNALGSVQQGLQNSVEPFRQAFEKAGPNIRDTVESLGQRTREAVDQFGRPLREHSILSTGQNNSQAILPLGSAPPQQTIGSPPSNDWQAPLWDDSQAITPGIDTGSALGLNTTPGQSATRNSNTNNTPSQILPGFDDQSQPTPFSQQQPSEQPNWPKKRYDMADLPNASNSSTSAESSGGRYDSNDTWPSVPSFPASTSSQSPRMDNTELNSRHTEGTNDSNRLSSTSSTPEIRRNMLNGPADAELETVSGQPAFSTSNQAPELSTGQLPGREPQASDLGLDSARRAAANDAPPRPVLPLILSWVLLSGSVVGNVYLFWSFVDVRSKYRGLVHNTRGSGSRHSGRD